MPEIENKYKIKNVIDINDDIIISKARATKRKDIYHSTTIEGYKVTPELIDAVVFGNKGENINNLKIEDIENILVIKGYSLAFDYLLTNYKKFDGKITEDMIKDIYQKMWTPLFEVSKLGEIEQRRYRNDDRIMKYAIGYSMPNWQDLYDIVDLYIELINKIDNPISKAIVGHFLFTPIQCFPDGNGRVSRFIMNYILISNGYNYLTIEEHNYRIKYLSQYGLDDTKLNNTFEEFYKFIYDQIT